MSKNRIDTETVTAKVEENILCTAEMLNKIKNTFSLENKNKLKSNFLSRRH